MCTLYKGLQILERDDAVKKLVSPRRDEVVSLLERYIKEIDSFNPAYGLVKVSGKKELIIKHILDSLSPLGILLRLCEKALKTGGKINIADVGSGAGLPGIPLAITMPDCDFTLIERMGKRAGFLFSTTALLGLSNITVEEEELEKTKSGRFDLVTFRAFSPINSKLLKTLFKTCKEGGIIAAYKGKKEKIDTEVHALNTGVKIIPYAVPFLDEERHLLVVESE